jgi:hypothetical protein
MTDKEKLEALAICKIEDVYQHDHRSSCAHFLAEEREARIMHLEHALLRLLYLVENNHELGIRVHAKSQESQKAWKLLKNPSS